MDEILHLKNTGRKDYFYEEAIKTLESEINSELSRKEDF